MRKSLNLSFVSLLVAGLLLGILPMDWAEAADSEFAVALGAFKGPIQAERLRAVASERGYDAKVLKIDSSGSILYNVTLTGFDTIREAFDTRDKLQAYPEFKDCYVLRYSQLNVLEENPEIPEAPADAPAVPEGLTVTSSETTESSTTVVTASEESTAAATSTVPVTTEPATDTTAVVPRAEPLIATVAEPARNFYASQAAAAYAGMGTGTVQAALALPTGDPFTSLLLVKIIAPKTVNMHQSFDYQLEASNLSSSLSLEDVQVTMRPDTSYQMQSSTPGSQRNAKGEYVWNLGKLDPKESKQISVSGSGSSVGSIVSCIYASYLPVACIPVQVIEPRLTLTKEAPADVVVCDPIPLRFVVANPGSGAATNVQLVDELPPGMTTADGKTTLRYNVGTLLPGESREFSADVRATRTGMFTNTANVSADTGLSATASTTTNVHEPVLAIEKNTAREWQYINRQVDFNISLTNTGDWVADDVIMEDFVPSGSEFVSATGDGMYDESTHKITWVVGSLQPNESRELNVTLTVRQFGILRNTVTARATCAKPVSAAAQVEVRGIPAVLLEVIDINDPNQIGEVEEYVITVTNQGSMDANDVTIVATIQPEGEYVDSSGASEGTLSDQTVSFAPVPVLKPKARLEWRVRVRAVRQGDTRFHVKMTTKRLTSPVEETESTEFYQ